MSGLLSHWRQDCALHYGTRQVPSVTPAALSNPSLVAALLFRLAAGSRSPAVNRVARWACLSLFSSDISAGAKFSGSIEFPHPTGIVIGTGVQVGAGVRIFQNVTLGSSRTGGYPSIGDNVTIFAGAVIAGGLRIGHGAVVGANAVVTRDVDAGAVVRAVNAL